MESIKVYKERALTSLKGNWGKGVVATLVYLLFIYVLPTVVNSGVAAAGLLPAAVNVNESFISLLQTVFLPVLGGLVLQIVFLPLSWGFSVFFFDISKGNNVRVGGLFDGMKQYGRIFTTNFLVWLYMTLWAMLPGIILFILVLLQPKANLIFFFLVGFVASVVIYFYKYYSYVMVPYILKDNPDIKNNKAINLSMKMMEDYKADLFLLDLSMIGWFILSILTCGIGLFFLLPYVNTAHAHFYEEIKRDMENYRKACEELGLDVRK